MPIDTMAGWAYAAGTAKDLAVSNLALAEAGLQDLKHHKEVAVARA